MSRTVGRLLLLAFVGTCLGWGCGPAKDEEPKNPSPLPAASERDKFPKRESHRH